MSKRRSRIPELDGFRVLLVFIVSWYHIWQQSWWTPRIGNVSLDFLVRSGYMPVDGTILLSGFLLFLPYARHMLCGEPYPSWREFYRRRIARIVPAYDVYLLVMLFAVALPWNLYSGQSFLWRDVLSHLTFTFTFRADTYMATPLGAACWTLAIEMQAYLLFPLLARWAVRKPAVTFPAMILCSWIWRYVCISQLSDYAMVVNQLPSFIDVYALGMMAALVYVKLSKISLAGWKRAASQLGATLLLVLCLWGTYRLLWAQAYSLDYASLQGGQMIHRFPYALLLAGIMLSLPFTIRPIRFLMGNRVMSFLAGISMNYYLIHQVVAVHLKRLGIPASVAENPNQVGEMPWQMEYTYLTFGISVLLAIALTYAVEKPCARLILRKKKALRTQKN